MSDWEFRCKDCPIVEDYERRIRVAEKYGFEPQLYYCDCAKVDGPFWHYGYCSDGGWEYFGTPKQGRRRTGRAYRRQMARKKKLALEAKAKRGKFIYENNGHVVRPHDSKRAQYWKRHANRAARRAQRINGGKAGYRRLFDLLWELY